MLILASVVYDAVAAAKARNADVLLVDTAGRLHNKKNLMEELGKINRILEKEYPEAYRETLGCSWMRTTGQNALVQAKEFSEVARYHRNCSDKDGRYGQRRYRCGYSVRTWYSGEIYRCRRNALMICRNLTADAVCKCII